MYFYLAAFIFSLILTYLVRIIAIKKSIIDTPNERSSHTVPTPRGGGLAIIVVWFAGLIYLFVNGQIEKQLFLALMSGIILAVISLLDDILDLKPAIRMLAQVITAAFAMGFLGGFNLLSENQNTVIWLISSIVVFIGIIWFINLFNFLDGIDAYASQEAILVATGILLLTDNQLSALLIAATAGFLIWNFPKAKIFMGDVGSTQLGFVLVVLGIYFHNTESMNISNWLILTSLFWFDATFTLYRRWRNNEQLSVAHKKHAYQRLVQGGFSHLKVDIYAVILNILLIGIVYLNHYYLHQGIILLIIVILVMFFINNRVDKVFKFK